MRSALLSFLAVAAVAEKSAFQSSVLSIKDQLSTVTLNGKARGGGLASVQREMVEKYLATVEQQELNENVTKMLTQIVDLLQHILVNLRAEAVTNQEELTLKFDEFAAIRVSTQSIHDTNVGLEAAMTSSEEDHVKCRIEEVNAQIKRDSDCGLFQSYLDMYKDHENTSFCEFPESVDSNAELDLFEQKLRAGKLHFRSALNLYENKSLPCETHFEEWEQKRVFCGQQQARFEGTFCTYRNAQDNVCTYEDTHYNLLFGQYQTLTSDHSSLSAQRTEDAKMISYLICMVTKLNESAQGQTDLTIMETDCGGLKTESYVYWANNISAAPAQESCERLLRWPGSIVNDDMEWPETYYVFGNNVTRMQSIYTHPDFDAPDNQMNSNNIDKVEPLQATQLCTGHLSISD